MSGCSPVWPSCSWGGATLRRGLLIEDVHWADAATLDFLTYLTRAGRAGAVPVVVTCRSDEVPLDAAVADWLTHVRRDAGVEEIRLGPLSQGEVAEQVTGLVGAPPPVSWWRRCTRGRRVIRSSPSSWWPPRSPTRGS